MPTTPAGTAYEIEGSSEKPAVVLIHGLGLCKELWDPFMPLFSQQYRVISYDLYGHGESVPCPTTASLTVYSKQIVALLDHLEIEKAALVGFSIGGMINRRMALDHGERISALAILNSPHDRGEEAQKAVEARALTVREEGPAATLEAALKRWFTENYLATGPGSRLVAQWREKVDPESYAQAAWVLANGVRELTGLPGAVTIPSIVITCERDSGSTPEMSRMIAQEIPNAEIQIIGGLKHLGLMEAPKPFSDAILGFFGRTL